MIERGHGVDETSGQDAPPVAGRLRERAERWLEGLAPRRLAALGAELSAELLARGLVVSDAEAGEVRPIPALLTPEPVDPSRFESLCEDAHRLLAAALKAARHVVSQPAGGGLAGRLFARFTPLEMAFLSRHPDLLGRVATARIDFFSGVDGLPVALEINATIPAMQGYSDMVSHGWLEKVASWRGLEGRAQSDLLARERCNTRDLLASLVAHYRSAGGRAVQPAIAVVSRRGDAQRSELRHYERIFTECGHPTLHVYSDELEIDAGGHARARGRRFELVYRHIFARRIDPGSVLARLLLEPGPSPVLNPILSPLEHFA